MANTIKIRDFGSVIQYADLEDIPNESPTVLKNFRVVYGKLVKTLEMGVKISDTFSDANRWVTGFTTWIHPRLTQSGTGFAYIIPFQETGNKLNAYIWVKSGGSGAWHLMHTPSTPLFPGVPFSASPYFYQTKDLSDGTNYRRNPIVQANDILRLLPGYTAKPDGSNVAVGAWIGWIGRDFFDGLYPASVYTAKFFGYPTKVEKPTFTPVIVQHDGDGAYSPSEDIPIIDGSQEQQFITIMGSYPGVFGIGKKIAIRGNPANYGVYGIDTSEVYPTQTKLWLDDTKAYVDRIGGSIRATVERESRWYKFSYVYDGNQESLLSDAYKVDFGDQKFPSFSASFLKADHNKRMTAIKVYRSSTGETGTYRHIHTIDFLRKAGEYKSGAEGAYHGERTIYIPALSDVTTSGALTIELWDSNTQNWRSYTTSSLSSGKRVIFPVTTDVEHDDFWDCAWKIESLSESGDSGAFAGQQAFVIGEDLEGISYSGGVLTFALGDYLHTTINRLVDAAHGRAVHMTAPIIAGVNSPANAAWKLFSTEKGLFYYVQSGSGDNTITWYFWDTGLPDGAPHPLEGEVSTEVHGQFAKMISGRLFQGRIVLDPAGKAEQRPEWASYSELDQPDVNPVSNILRFQDREGGEITGLEEIWGLAVFLKKQAIFTVNCKFDPADPTRWSIVESMHNIGNVAPQGYVRVGDDLYVCAYDGIYRIKPNNLAASDSTPTEKLKITEPINNVYNAMTQAQKEAIKGIYHQRRNEVHWFFIHGTDTKAHWVYNVITGAWREIGIDKDVLFLALDENANALALNVSDDDYTGVVLDLESQSDPDENYSRCIFRSKVFPISEERAEPIHDIKVIYQSPHELLLNLYIDGNETPVIFTLPAQEKYMPRYVKIGYRASRLQFEITDATDTGLVAEAHPTAPVYLIVEQNEVSPNVEIGGMDIVHG